MAGYEDFADLRKDDEMSSGGPLWPPDDPVPGDQGPERPPRRERREHVAVLPVWFLWVLGVPAVVVAIAVLLILFDAVASYGRIHPGVRVGTVSVGRMRPEEARSTLQSVLGGRLTRAVHVTSGSSDWNVDASQVGATFDVNVHVTRAMDVGRRGDLITRARDRWVAWTGGVRLQARVSVDRAKTDTVLDGFSGAVNVAPRDATVSVEATAVRLVPAVIGVRLDRRRAESEVVAAFLSTDREVVLPVISDPVRVTDADAKGAVEDAEAMIAGPVSLRYGKHIWKLTATSVAGCIEFRAIPFAAPDETVFATPSAAPSSAVQTSDAVAAKGRMRLVAYLDSQDVSRTVGPLTKGLGRAPRDAEFRTSGGQVTIVPSQVGIAVDMSALARDLREVLTAGGVRTATLRLAQVEPGLSTAKARTLGIRERISTFSTTYSSGNLPRVNNIHLLATALDGALIAPGEIFSFNEHIGERTAQKGYVEAPAIVQGRLVPQLGGGICQVGTTVFNTVFFSGLPVIERHNHSQYISHYPKGRDATVSWGGPDFKFQNDTKKWVLLKASFTSSSLTVSLYGTKPGYDVSLETGPFTDVHRFTVREVQDATLTVGTRVIEQPGIDGRRVVVRRVVRDAAGKVVRRDSFTSIYQAVEQVVRVGTRPRPSTNPTPTGG